MGVPKLRFKRFFGEWQKEKLREIAERINSGKTPLGGSNVYTDVGILFIRSQNVFDDKLSLENSTFISEEVNNTMRNSVVKANDILLNITGASLGRSCVVPNDFKIGNVNQHVCIIRIKNENNPRFIQPILSSTRGQYKFVNLQTGSGREGLNFESIKNIEVFLPSLSEQNKIADFLTSVDEKINLLKKKKELLEQYKKGVMHKIFSQELRFKDEEGKDFPEWESRILGDLLDYEQPTKYIVSSTEYHNSFEIPVLTAGKTFILGYTNETENVFTNLPVIIFDDFTTATQFVTFPFKVKSSAMKILRPKLTTNLRYIYAAMQGIQFEVGGHGRHWISVYSTLEIEIPSEREQQKIADFLTALDDKIALVEQHINKTELWKKGLLQQMFV